MVLSRANTRGFELFMYGFFEGEGVAQVHPLLLQLCCSCCSSVAGEGVAQAHLAS